MLTTRANTAALLDRLGAVPDAVQAALAAYARSRTPASQKAAMIRDGLGQSRARRLQPDRAAAVERFERPESLAPLGRGRGPAAGWEGEGSSGEARRSPSPYPLPGGERGLQQIAVQAALKALGRSR